MLKMKHVVLCMVIGLLLAQTSLAADPNAVDPNTVDPNMLGWWPLSDGVGDVVMDVSGNANDGVISGENGGWVEDAEFGPVLSFGGDVNGLSVYAGEIPQMTLENGFTWAFWGNQDEALVGLNQIVVGNRYNAEGVDFAPRQFTKFTPTKFEWHANGANAGNLNYSEPMVAGEWTHHALIKDANVVTYYRDGGQDAQGIITLGLDGPMPLYFGGDGNGIVGENWMGMMSDVRVYTKALTVDELSKIVPVVLEDFEGDPNLPGWTIEETGEESLAIVADPLDPNNNVLKLGPGPSTVMHMPWVVDPNATTTLGFSLLSDAIDPNDPINNTVIGAADGAGFSWGNYLGYVRMAGAGIDYRDGGDFVNAIPEIDAMTWYDVVLAYDLSARTYDVYIEGVLMVEGAAFRSADLGGIQKVLIRQWTPDNNVGYIDNIVAGVAVPEKPDPEPEPEPVVE